jgi:hypothetical protein
MARVTLQTVADRVGVSRMTVSNAFSRPDQLSAGLRERSLAAAGELGYAGPEPCPWPSSGLGKAPMARVRHEDRPTEIIVRESTRKTRRDR